jgi:hypothetical protein
MLLSCLTEWSPEPTSGCTLNAGQRGRTHVDLGRGRLWPEWVLAASKLVAVVIRQTSRNNGERVHVTEEIDVKNGSRRYFGLMQQGEN